jgi:hypothetical protein
MGRFENLKRTADRVEAGTLKPETKKAEPAPRQSTAKTSSLKDKLGARKPAASTVRMSVEITQEMHDQITQIAVRAGIAKVEVIREILKETLPELID